LDFLAVSAAGRFDEKVVFEPTHPFQGNNSKNYGASPITPGEKHWLESAEVLSRMRARRGYTASKLRDLAFDTLIALSAREAGATLVTCDQEDFAEIGKYVAFRALFW
jgi:predicted nucleic acid-binding protein